MVSSTKWWANIDWWAKFFQIVAVILGGLWVWFNSIRGRVFVPRLQLQLSGNLVSVGGSQHVRVTIQCKNAGSSIVHLKEKGNALMIYPLLKSPIGKETIAVILGPAEEKAAERPVEIMAVRVLMTYKVWIDEADIVRVEPRAIDAIEPATAIDQEYLIPVPAEYDAFKLELRVVVAKGGFREWLGWWWKKVWGKKPEKPGTALSATTVVARVDKQI
jgi:hypothetical protein